MFEIIDKAQSLWPRATEAEIGLLKRIFDGADESRAIQILEDARIGSKYASIPFNAIKDKAKVLCNKSSLNGAYIECWAVNCNNDKTYNCMVLATNDAGAKVMMEKYLFGVCRVEPSEYTLFVGEGSQQNALRYRVNRN